MQSETPKISVLKLEKKKLTFTRIMNKSKICRLKTAVPCLSFSFLLVSLMFPEHYFKLQACPFAT